MSNQCVWVHAMAHYVAPPSSLDWGVHGNSLGFCSDTAMTKRSLLYYNGVINVYRKSA